MHGPSRSRTWADEHILNKNGTGSLDATQPVSEKHRSNNEGQDTSASVQQSTNISRKVKDDNLLPIVRDSNAPVKEAQEEIDASVSASLGGEDHTMADKDADRQVQPNATISDTEWLRSRTSRLLGLEDDVEGNRLSRSVSPEEQKNPLPRSKKVKAPPDPTADEQADEQTKEEVPPDPAPSLDIPGTDLRSGNCRLFVRNLPYSASESDLREQFAPYGELTEVRMFFSGILIYGVALPARLK